MSRIIKAPRAKRAITHRDSFKPIEIRRRAAFQLSDDGQRVVSEYNEKLGHNLANISLSYPNNLAQLNSKEKIESQHQNSQQYKCNCPLCSSGSLTVQKSQESNFSTKTKIENKNNGQANEGVITEKVEPRVQGGFWSKIKRGFKKVGGAIKKGFKKVGTGFKKLGKWLKKGFKKIGRGLKKFGKWAWSGIKWVGKQLWSKLKGIFLRVVNWIRRLPERVGRLLRHIWQGVKSLKPWSLKWWKSLGKASTWEGFLKWLGTSIIYILETAGIGEIYETLMDFIKFNTRPLTGSEISRARVVFGNAIDYGLVRVDEYALLGPSWTGRAYVSFHTINAWGTLDDHTLIHELTHVWQYQQMGAIYMPKAIHAQNTKEGYNYTIEDLEKQRNAGKGFTSFNLEQQGEILGDYYIGKTTGKFDKTTLELYEYFVADVRR